MDPSLAGLKASATIGWPEGQRHHWLA